MDKVVQRGKIELVVSEISIPTIDSHRKFSWGGGGHRKFSWGGGHKNNTFKYNWNSSKE